MLQVTGLVLSLGSIVLLVKKNFQLYQAVGVGLIIVMITIGKPLGEVLSIFWGGLIDKATIEVVLAVVFVSLLGKVLKEMKFLEGMSNSIVNFLNSPKIAIIIVPMLIAILPIMGGAILSAPLVDDLGDRLGFSPVIKSSVNNMFRHSVFYFSPFNPSLILLSYIAGVDIIKLIMYLFPLGLVNIIAGYFVFLHKAKIVKAEVSDDERKDSFLSRLKSLFFYGGPLFLTLILFMIFKVNLIISLTIGILLAILLGDKRGIDFKDIFTKGWNLKLAIGILGIMIFRSFVENMASIITLVSNISQSGVPIYLLFILIPFFIGWVSASFSVAVGIAAPLLIPQLRAGEPVIFYAVLLYASGFLSYYISPIHMCQIVSNHYFKVKTSEVFKVQYSILIITFLVGLTIFAFGMISAGI